MVKYFRMGDVELQRLDKNLPPLVYQTCLDLLFNINSIVPTQDLTRREILVNEDGVTVDAKTAGSFSRYLIIDCYPKKQIKVCSALTNITKRDKLEQQLKKTFPDYELEWDA